MTSNIKLFASELLYKLNYPTIRASKNTEIIQGLKDEGCFLIESFLDEETCRKLVKEANDIIDSRPELVQSESNNSDSRIYGVERFTDAFEIDHLDNLSNEIFKKFTIHFTHDGFKLLGRIRSSNENLGSGGGWHRDAPFMHQFKTILYLTDVEEDNGPFQYIKGSNKNHAFKKANKFLKKKLNDYRFTNEEVEALYKEGLLPPPTTITAPAGSLLFADTRGLHRGRPLQSGERFAITHYHFNHKIDKGHFFKE